MSGRKLGGRLVPTPATYWHCDTIPLGTKCWGNSTARKLLSWWMIFPWKSASVSYKATSSLKTRSCICIRRQDSWYDMTRTPSTFTNSTTLSMDCQAQTARGISLFPNGCAMKDSTPWGLRNPCGIKKKTVSASW